MPETRRRPTPEQASWLHSVLGIDISKYADEAEGAVSGAESAVVNGVQDAGHAVVQTASDVGHAVAHGAEQAKDGVVHAAEAVGEEAMKAIHEAVAFMKEVGTIAHGISTELGVLGHEAESYVVTGAEECSSNYRTLGISVVAAVGSAATLINALVATPSPAAVIAVPVVIIAGTTCTVAVLTIINNGFAIEKCMSDAVANKQKALEAHQQQQHEQNEINKVENQEEDLEQQNKRLQAEIDHLIRRHKTVHEAHSRLSGHVKHLRALVKAAPRGSHG